MGSATTRLGLGNSFLQNLTALYALQAANWILPLVTLPYLARVLGPRDWGMLMIAQAYGAYVTLLVEYGFNLSASREVARHRDDLKELAELLAGVMAAKIVLAILPIGLAVFLQFHLAVLGKDPTLLWSAVFAGVAQGFSLLWYFQGLERIRFAALLDASARAAATIGVFVLVHKPADAWIVPALQGATALLAMWVALAVAHGHARPGLPSVRLVWETLRMGWSMFLFRSAVSLYTVGNSFILGLFVAPTIVGYYAGAEKISKACLSVLQPVSQTVYPRLSHLADRSRLEAARLARTSAQVMGIGGILLGVTTFVFAPVLISLLLGKSYLPAVPVVRVLSLLPALISLSSVLGIQWMLPLGLDRAFNTIILTAGLLNLALALLLAPRYAQMGMACAVVVSELFVTASMYVFLRWSALDPITLTAKVEAEEA